MGRKSSLSFLFYGALAQIGERLPGREKAAGAVPVGSTISICAGTLTSKGPTR